MLFMHEIPCALVLALPKAGRSSDARMAMMAMTTSNSIKVKPEAEGQSALPCAPRKGQVLGVELLFITASKQAGF